MSNLPKTRGDCAGGPRPCPLVGCKYNTYLDVVRKGSDQRLRYLVIYKEPREPEDVPPHESCVLDIADAGGVTLEEIGAMMNVTRET